MYIYISHIYKYIHICILNYIFIEGTKTVEPQIRHTVWCLLIVAKSHRAPFCFHPLGENELILQLSSDFGCLAMSRVQRSLAWAGMDVPERQSHRAS